MQALALSLHDLAQWARAQVPTVQLADGCAQIERFKLYKHGSKTYADLADCSKLFIKSITLFLGKTRCELILKPLSVVSELNVKRRIISKRQGYSAVLIISNYRGEAKLELKYPLEFKSAIDDQLLAMAHQFGAQIVDY